MQPSSSPDRRVRNAIGWRQRLARFQGVPVDFDLRRYDDSLRNIETTGRTFEACADADLSNRARVLRAEVNSGAPLEQVRDEFFALAREAAHRTLRLRPFHEQILVALALDDGRIVEMQTGEGKTLAAVMPAALHALTGRGVHVLTFNDYLARRDAEWMGPIYTLLGLSVAYVAQTMSADERRAAYRADVTYVTAKEAGFDHLRDVLVTDPQSLVHRPFHMALVDEADSLLVDEARVPLVIAGSVAVQASQAPRLAALVAGLTAGVHYDRDEYLRNVELTDAGIEYVEGALGVGSLHSDDHTQLLAELNCALHARVLLRRDVDYIVRDRRIGIVDEFTGRVVPDRHWPDGLQAALEAKEGIDRGPDGRILGSITLQHFLQSYERLCGMTGTAQTAALDFHTFYGLDVAVVPTHRPMIRIDQPDVVFTHREAKERAIIAEVCRAHAVGRPVLVGTLTIEESERLASRLRDAGVECQVLNARNDAIEAQIVAAAGARGAVTISTNMAGRGTDIRLGGSSDDGPGDREVAALGGLYVIGTNRHESLRIDLQLRGRAGRQGDPGESRFFVSLEDDLLVRYGIESLLAGHVFPERGDAPINDVVAGAEIARVQRIIEGQNFEIRKTLWRYASVIERQRREVMATRQSILHDAGSPGVWPRDDERRRALVEQAGEDAVSRAERTVMLAAIDRAWRDHLAFVADLREGIHLVGLGGQDPLTRFTADVNAAFKEIDPAIDAVALAALERVSVRDGRINLDALDIRGPSSTWTYLVNDDPFRDRIGMMLTGPGRATMAISAAALAGPLLLLWGVVNRLWRRHGPRR